MRAATSALECSSRAIGHQFRRPLVQIGLLGLSVLMLVGGGAKMVQLPRAAPTTAVRPTNVDW